MDSDSLAPQPAPVVLSPDLFRGQASDKVTSNQRDLEGFVEEKAFELSLEGDGKEHSRSGEWVQRRKRSVLYWWVSIRQGREGWTMWRGGELSDKSLSRHSEGTGQSKNFSEHRRTLC